MSDENEKHCYIISYDIKEESSAKIIEKIKKTAWAHITESTWAVLTNEKVADLRTRLATELPPGSRLFVIRSGGVAAWRNVLCSNEWLKKYV